MCGIVGIINLKNNDNAISRQSLECMLHNIRHRGPDDEGVYLSDDLQVGLGAVRLSFLDLENGHQPIVSKNKDAVIVYNGEVYDFQASKMDLERHGFQFQTRTDTEYVLNNYLHKGIDSFKDLNGEFVFAIYDSQRRTTIIARDHFGMRPLYFTIQQDRLFFASEIKGIFAIESIERSFNIRTIVEQLMRADSLARTAFNNINILRPGHFICVKNNQVSIQQYWDLQLPTITEDARVQKPLEYYELLVEETLSQSVKTRLEADVPLGCFLSGGLDSSIIAALMQKHSSQPIHTFSIQFKDKQYDESSYASIMSQHIGSKHHVVSLSAVDLARDFPKALFHCEHFVQQIDGTGKYLLAKEAARHVKGVLVGEGADELFLGYPWFKVIQVLDNQYNQNSTVMLDTISQQETARKGLDLTLHEHCNIDNYKKKYGFYPVSIGNILEMQKFAYDLFNPDIMSTIKKYDPCDIYLEDLNQNQLKSRGLLRQNQYEFIKKTLPYYIFQFLGGKMEMAHSLEGRLPFFDKRLVALATQIPKQFLLNGLSEKYILRKAFDSYLPKSISSRLKHGYSSPILSGFLDNKAPDYFYEMLDERTTKDVGIFCPTAVNKLLTMCKERKGFVDQTTTLYERAMIFVISVHLMHHMFIKNFPSICRDI
jgi:asparagine synthase (glutamine-hydrolysing)